MILRVQNFCRHADTTLDLTGQGIVLLAGKNGSGKTSLVPDGLCFGWYGKTLRGTSGKDVVRREAGKHCCVTIEDTTLDGKPYVLSRLVSWPGKPTALLAIEGESEIYGAQEVTAAVQQRITGCSFNVFAVSRVFGKRFFTKLSDNERKAVLDEVVQCVGTVDFPSLAAGRERAVEYYAKLKADMAALTTALAVLDERCAAAQAFVDEATQAVHLFAQTPGPDSAHWKGMAEQARRVVKVLEGQRAKAIALRPSVVATYDQAVEKHAAAEAEFAERKAEREAADAITTQVAKQLVNLEGLHSRFEKLDGKCATCLQNVPETHSSTVLERLSAKKKALLADYNVVLANRSATTTQEMFAYAKVQTLLEARLKAGTAHTVLEKNIAEQEKRIAEGKEKAAEFEVKAAMHGTQEQQLADAESALSRAQLKLNAALLERTVTNGKLADLLRLSIYVEHWLKGFSPQGIRSLLLDIILPTLNTEAAEIASILTGGELSVVFDTQTTLKSGDQKERFDVRVLLHGVEVPYDTCSTGEQKRADIIATLALGRASKAFTKGPLLVVDEVFDGLDEDGIDGAVELLSHLAAFYSTITVVTHDKAFASRFDRVALVEAGDSGSTVTWHEGGADAFEG